MAVLVRMFCPGLILQLVGQVGPRVERQLRPPAAFGTLRALPQPPFKLPGQRLPHCRSSRSERDATVLSGQNPQLYVTLAPDPTAPYRANALGAEAHGMVWRGERMRFQIDAQTGIALVAEGKRVPLSRSLDPRTTLGWRVNWRQALPSCLLPYGDRPFGRAAEAEHNEWSWQVGCVQALSRSSRWAPPRPT
jgi:hypothetical protein